LTRLRGPRCSVCKHPDKWRIELLRAGGASLDSLAEKFSVGRDAIHRHWQAHVTADAKGSYLAGPSQMADLHAKAAAEGESVVDYFRIIRTALMASLTACSEAGDARGVAIVAAQLIATLEKLGKITGEIATIAGTLNVNVAVLQHPEFARAQAMLLKALAPYHDARMAVVAALRELDADAPLGVPQRTQGPRQPAPLVIEHEAEPAPSVPPPPY
jgi:hypothetical protein